MTLLQRDAAVQRKTLTALPEVWYIGDLSQLLQ
jgi:hypothetical protein